MTTDRSEALRDGLRQLSMPVTIVAAGHEAARSCATTTAMYASLEPPTVVVSLASTSTTLRLIRTSDRFVVSVLAEDQRGIAETASKRTPEDDKFAALGIAAIATGASAGLGVTGALAILVCHLHGLVTAGDHVCCIGTVRAVELGDLSQRPLVRVRRAYGTVDLGADVDRSYPI